MTRRTVVEREAARVVRELYGVRSVGAVTVVPPAKLVEAMRRVERATLRRVRANLRALLDRDESWDDRDVLACCRPERKR